MSKCKICNSDPTLSNGLCEHCNDVLFYLDEIENEYFKGAAGDPIIKNALREFSWLYAGFPRLWGFYNCIVSVIFFFITNLSRNKITKADLKDFNFTTLPVSVIEDILIKTRAIKPPKSTKPNEYEIGVLSKTCSVKIGAELQSGTGRFRENAEEMFGIIAIILTKTLVNKKLANPADNILPRKAFSILVALADIIINNDDSKNPGSPIPKIINRSNFENNQKRLGLGNNAQLKTLLEMLGLIVISPGIPNIIDGFGDTDRKLVLKDEIVLLLTELRVRRRNRVRIRTRP